uniref:Uncharacterized protein n=1 Tax=viral metagenome TaxID=1070528 RepID=A0A6C0ATV1_9ZZZZ
MDPYDAAQQGAPLQRPRATAVRHGHRVVEQECAYRGNFHQGTVFSVISLLLAVTGIVVSILVVTLHADSVKRHVTARVNDACNGSSAQQQQQQQQQ